jgi:hypothetical protein
MLLIAAVPAPASPDPGPFVRALWLFQRFGQADAVGPERDQALKGALFKALDQDGGIRRSGVRTLMSASTWDRLGGDEERLGPEEVRHALDSDRPASRDRLDPRVRAHAEWLTTSYDLIDEPHRQAGAKLVEWLVSNHRTGEPLHVTVICTGNSRRSMLGAVLGNIASAYHGLPEIRFHSGGTAPSAFNRRTIATLQAIGVDIEPTGSEAPRGEPDTPNPIHRVRWGSSRPGEPPLEMTEFSKTYQDPANPSTGFAALLVCGEADAACPAVIGASVRISMPYLDPKLFDDSPYEAQKYAERRDDIGRLMLSVLSQVRNRLGPAPAAR